MTSFENMCQLSCVALLAVVKHGRDEWAGRDWIQSTAARSVREARYCVFRHAADLHAGDRSYDKGTLNKREQPLQLHDNHFIEIQWHAVSA
jgi:hypothetical protein